MQYFLSKKCEAVGDGSNPTRNKSK